MSGNPTMRHPFICGRPVKDAEFINREDELRTIINRLRKGESTAIVGEPHIGKSSLLLRVKVEAKQEDSLIASFLNLHSISNDYTPVDFWNEVLEPLREHPDDASATKLEAANKAGYTRRSLERLFNHLGKHGLRLVLLLDEFESLLPDPPHPKFSEFAFFATLRGLASLTGGLCYVTASRLPVSVLNKRCDKLLGSSGSPAFNITTKVQLYPFGEDAVNTLLDRAGDAFSPNDRLFILRMAGRHPYLLQAMAAAMIETTGDDRRARAALTFYEGISSHFDALWRTLDDRTRTTSVILSLVELGKRAQGRKFACGEIENADSFGPELKKLAKRGLAEKVGKGWQFDRQHLLLWRGGRWTIASQAFAWWVRDTVIAETRQFPTCDEWLRKKRYGLFLTQEQRDWLTNTIHDAPTWAVQGVGMLCRAILKELTRKK